ncbi:hypothetical protein B0H19DRAFT_572557 [Mycena capillaripes]|nr:hypothetical protein B0H19DRAFT_572557 [Mycena capillaripes]
MAEEVMSTNNLSRWMKSGDYTPDARTMTPALKQENQRKRSDFLQPRTKITTVRYYLLGVGIIHSRSRCSLPSPDTRRQVWIYKRERLRFVLASLPPTYPTSSFTMKISLNLHAFLGASLALTLSSGATIHTRRDNSACEPRAHVVIDSFTVEIYNATIHGTDGHLRLFKMIPLACPDRHTGMLPRESSSRTDLQLRDTRTELSTIVYRRGFFTWVNSLLKWVPYAKTAVGLFNLGECIWDWVERGKSVVGGAACVLGGITTVYGIGELLQKNGVISLPTGSTHIKELIEYVDKTFANLSDFVLSRRADNPEFSAAVAKYHTLIQNWTLPGIRHYATGDGVTLWDVARANATHPITILHSNRAFKANHSHAVNVWSSVPIPGSGVPRFHLTVPFPYASNTTSTFPSAASSELRRRQGSSGSSGDGGGSSASACGSNVNDLGQLSECITQTGPAPRTPPKACTTASTCTGPRIR